MWHSLRREASRSTRPPHGVRRTFVSLLLAAGADVPYVMAQAGHSDPKQTLGYASVIAGTDHGATMDELVHKDVNGPKRH